MTASDDPRVAGVTPAMRDYLTAIDLLGGGALPVTTQQIAGQIGVACPSVTNMIKRLHERGLVSYEPYHGARLTETGQDIAAATSRRRHLLERYLAERLGYAREDARMEARRLEGAVTGALETHIEAALSAPLVVSSGTPRLTAVVGPVDCSLIADDQHLA